MNNPVESGAAAAEIIRAVGQWQVPALGAGTWALGGPWEFAGAPAGWGEVDDEVSIAAVRAAYEGGVRLFDTADAYGCGHAERVLGKAVAPFRNDVVIATKVGLIFDETTRTGNGIDISPAYIRRACEASLRRLGTDHIDLYQLHPGEVTADQAPAVVEVFRPTRRRWEDPQLRDGQRGRGCHRCLRRRRWMRRSAAAAERLQRKRRRAGALRGPRSRRTRPKPARYGVPVRQIPFARPADTR
jgi:hypothetical protein